MGRILSIDYGLKRIGLAISDELKSFAFPCGVIENKNFDFVLQYLKTIIIEKEINLIIIGMPYSWSRGSKAVNPGKKMSMENLVCKFVKKLKISLSIPVEVFDERFSSFAAQENLKESGISAKKSKKFIDAEAARLILEEYLQSTKK